MDNITHSLVGALIGQAGLKRKTGLAMPALIIGANLPDVDATCFFWLDGQEHLGFRRGLTHGPLAIVLLPLVLAGLLWGYDRWQASRGKRPDSRARVSFTWLYLLSLIGCITHPALDWLNVYGIRLLEPFSSRWFYGDTLFIIDVWLWALMGFATWFSLRRERQGKASQWPAIAALGASIVYIGANWVTTNIAWVPYAHSSNSQSVPANQLPSKPDIPSEQKIASPLPFWSFQREMIVGSKNNYYVISPGKAPIPSNAVPITSNRCGWPDMERLRQTNSELDAFLFWSRAPFAERAQDGSVIVYDARFYHPMARDRFSLPLPGVRCQPIEP